MQTAKLTDQQYLKNPADRSASASMSSYKRHNLNSSLKNTVEQRVNTFTCNNAEALFSFELSAACLTKPLAVQISLKNS